MLVCSTVNILSLLAYFTRQEYGSDRALSLCQFRSSKQKMRRWWYSFYLLGNSCPSWLWTWVGTLVSPVLTRQRTGEMVVLQILIGRTKSHNTGWHGCLYSLGLFTVLMKLSCSHTEVWFSLNSISWWWVIYPENVSLAQPEGEWGAITYINSLFQQILHSWGSN